MRNRILIALLVLAAAALVKAQAPVPTVIYFEVAFVNVAGSYDSVKGVRQQKMIERRYFSDGSSDWIDLEKAKPITSTDMKAMEQ